ncbi:hypothetical protein KZ774_24895 [Escherichia coli]|nr:hypothetical protein [Escherichia coli]
MRDVHFTPWTGGDGCGCISPPATGGLKQVNGTGQNNGQGTRRNDVKRGLRNGVAPCINASPAKMEARHSPHTTRRPHN